LRTHLQAVCLVAISVLAQAQNPIKYRLAYAESGGGMVSVGLTLPEPVKAPAPLVMPRTYPGGYEQVPYDSFVTGVVALSPNGQSLVVAKDADGPRWSLGKAGDTVQQIEYRVDIGRMEAQILDAVSSSKVREGYIGLLGYSVFAYVEGLADRQIQVRLDAPEGWPALTTLSPVVPPLKTTASAIAPDYYALADSEILMGPDLRVTKLEGRIPLVMATYSEGGVDMALEGRLAREALDRVQDYFGDTPFRQYTVQLEVLRPLPGHDYNFSQEHIDSGTFIRSVDATAQVSAQQQSRTRFNYAHHMAHCWIPKRAYGTGYRPFTWEMTPVIDTIWFNEGFGQYAAIEALAAAMPPAESKAFRDARLASYRSVLDAAAPFLRRMSLPVLSREASFLYAVDFRTGKNVYSRGALIAAEMDDRIRARSENRKSLRDALRWLLRWSAENQKPFQTEDLPRFFAAATGVDVSDILERWMKSLE